MTKSPVALLHISYINPIFIIISANFLLTCAAIVAELGNKKKKSWSHLSFISIC